MHPIATAARCRVALPNHPGFTLASSTPVALKLALELALELALQLAGLRTEGKRRLTVDGITFRDTAAVERASLEVALRLIRALRR